MYEAGVESAKSAGDTSKQKRYDRGLKVHFWLITYNTSFFSKFWYEVLWQNTGLSLSDFNQSLTLSKYDL